MLCAQDHFEVIWCISDFSQPCISKMVARRVKRTIILTSRVSTWVHRVLLTVKCARSF